MPSTVKSSWRLVAGTFGVSLVLFLLPRFVFKREILAVNKDFWYYIALRVACALVFVFLMIRVVITRDSDTSGGLRALTIGIAALYFIITMAGAAQYRSDASQGIQYDKKTSQAVKIGERSWNI